MTRIGIGTLISLLACLVATAAPAVADSQAHRDARADVQVIEGIKQAPAPNIDILSIRNTYRGRTLTLAMKVADLRERGYAAQWNLRVGSDKYYLYYDYFGRKPQVGFFQSTDGRPGTTHARPRQPAGCRGTKVAVRGNYVIGQVSQHCVGGANQLRIASFVTRSADDGFRIDDAWTHGYDIRTGVRYGPLLRRN